MAVVCENRDSASLLRSFTDKLYTLLKEGKKPSLLSADEINRCNETHMIIGIVTLVDLI
jgi:hypothetical protein